jgi:TPR repeat protein
MKILLSLCLSLSLFGASFGDNVNISTPNFEKDDFEIGVEKFNKGQYEEAGDIFANLMVNGDKRSTYYLGKMFGEGLGVQKDCKKSLFFIFTAIKEGSCDGNKLLSDWLTTGTCVKKDIEKSKKYLNIYNKCLIK